jgi:hypothetical protein
MSEKNNKNQEDQETEEELRIRLICSCGEQVMPPDWLRHMRFSENKDRDHKVEKIIELNSGIKVEDAEEAKKKWGVSVGKLKKTKADIETGPREETEIIKTHVLGEVTQTEILIHPYIYELFYQAMLMFPKDYPEDSEDNLSRFLLELALHFRACTDGSLPWEDAMSERIEKILGYTTSSIIQKQPETKAEKRLSQEE